MFLIENIFFTSNRLAVIIIVLGRMPTKIAEQLQFLIDYQESNDANMNSTAANNSLSSGQDENEVPNSKWCSLATFLKNRSKVPKGQLVKKNEKVIENWKRIYKHFAIDVFGWFYVRLKEPKRKETSGTAREIVFGSSDPAQS